MAEVYQQATTQSDIIISSHTRGRVVCVESRTITSGFPLLEPSVQLCLAWKEMWEYFVFFLLFSPLCLKFSSSCSGPIKAHFPVSYFANCTMLLEIKYLIQNNLSFCGLFI